MLQTEQTVSTIEPTTVITLDAFGQKVQNLFTAGAVFAFGPELPVPESSNKKRFNKIQYYQPKIAGGKVVSAHDGGAWIGFVLDDGTRYRTASPNDASKLRELAESIDPTVQQHIGDIGIHLDPVCALVH